MVCFPTHPQALSLFHSIAGILIEKNLLSGEVGNVSSDDLLHLLLNLLGEDTTTELLEESRVLSLELLSERLLPGADLVDVDRVEETVDTGVDKRGHDLSWHRGVLRLLEELSETGTSVKEVSGRGITKISKIRFKGQSTHRSEPNWAKAATSRY